MYGSHYSAPCGTELLSSTATGLHSSEDLPSKGFVAAPAALPRTVRFSATRRGTRTPALRLSWIGLVRR